MSEDYARSCSGKKRYNSLRRAQEVAKGTKITFGMEFNAYLCHHCQRFHVGATHPWDGGTARAEKEVQ